jgi:hypothetical protein
MCFIIWEGPRCLSGSSQLLKWAGMTPVGIAVAWCCWRCQGEVAACLHSLHTSCHCHVPPAISNPSIVFPIRHVHCAESATGTVRQARCGRHGAAGTVRHRCRALKPACKEVPSPTREGSSWNASDQQHVERGHISDVQQAAVVVRQTCRRSIELHCACRHKWPIQTAAGWGGS